MAGLNHIPTTRSTPFVHSAMTTDRVSVYDSHRRLRLLDDSRFISPDESAPVSALGECDTCTIVRHPALRCVGYQRSYPQQSYILSCQHPINLRGLRIRDADSENERVCRCNLERLEVSVGTCQAYPVWTSVGPSRPPGVSRELLSCPCRLVVKSPRCGSHKTVAPQVQFLPGTFLFLSRYRFNSCRNTPPIFVVRPVHVQAEHVISFSPRNVYRRLNCVIPSVNACALHDDFCH